MGRHAASLIACLPGGACVPPPLSACPLDVVECLPVPRLAPPPPELLHALPACMARRYADPLFPTRPLIPPHPRLPAGDGPDPAAVLPARGH